MKNAATLQFLLNNTIPEPNSGCLLWLGAMNQFGYGRAKVNGKRTVVHRAIYVLQCGPVAAGLELDHLCRVRCCVNTAHLEPVTKRINALRGNAGVAHSIRQKAKTHCPRGHPYSGDNLFVRKITGYRECRMCMRLRETGGTA